jgi:6-phosphogluconolactonase (cycloisomerase 2 family)
LLRFDADTVSQYVLGSSDGSLTPLSVPTVSAGQHPFSIAVEPTGEYVYVCNYGSNTISQYRIGSDGTLSAIGSGTGALIPMTTPKVASGNSPAALTIDPTGKFLYATDRGTATISQFNIGTGGVLLPMTNPTVASGLHPTAIATGY